MQKQIAILFLLIGLFMFTFAEAQVKIGDNPQVIDPASILELESSDKVLVITRVDSLQMTTIVPNRGALVYNTTADCIFYYDGTQWINMCGATGSGPGGTVSADPIVNDISTIVITPTGNGNNFEVAPNSINSEQIVNGGINGVDIQDGSIGPGKLQNNSVTQDKLSENSVGAFALDNDNVDLGDFTNNAGFITSANIISTDPDNAIIPGTDAGAFYDDTFLQNSIAANTAAIAADNDQSATNEIQTLSISGDQLTLTGANTITIPTANGSDTKINPSGANITVTGTGTIADPYIINAADQADPSITNELTDLDFDTGTNILSLTNGATALGSSVDLSSLAGGGGGALAQINSTATITVAGDGSAGNPYELTAVGGAGGTTEVADLTTILGVGTGADPFRIAPGGGGQFLSTDGGGAVVWADLPPDQTAAEVEVTANGNLTSTDVQAALEEIQSEVDGLILTGGGSNNQAFDVANDSIRITDGAGTLRISLDELGIASGGENTAFEIANDSLRITDGAGTLTVPLDSLAHTGTTKGIFVADGNGIPTNPVHPTNGNLSLFWDNEARVVGPFAYGALGVGLDGNPISQIVKAHIEDIVTGGLSYPLQIQNRSNTGATGIVFSVIGGSSTRGKGVLAFERNGAQGIGDFHFLQDTNTDTGTADLGDKSFSILSNKNIQLYGNLIARNGPGTNGQVLTTNAAGETVWGAGGGGSIADTDANDGLSDFNGTAGYNINVDDATIEIDIDALQIKDDGITTAKILDGEVQTNDIADANVTLAKIAPLTPAPATEQMLITTTAGDVAWAPVLTGGGTTELADQSTIIGDGQLGSEFQVADGGIDTQQMADDAVTTAKIGDGEVQTTDIADANVTLAKIEPLTPAPATDQMLITNTSGAVTWSPVSTGGTNLENTNLVQTEALRTYEVGTGQALVFTGLGDVGFGNGANPPLSKFHFAGEVRVEGINSSGGSTGAPAYSFSTADDSNTGMYRPAADQIGFSVGGFEAMRIEEPSASVNKVVINQTLELEGQILDESNTAGTAGQVLTATATGTAWAAPAAGAVITGTTIDGDGTVGNELEIADDAVTAAKLNDDIVGTGLTRAADGSLDVDTSVLTGSGSINGSEIVVTGGANATFTNVTLEIANDAVTTAKIANGTIEGEDMAPDSIDATILETDAVGSDEIQTDAVTTVKILNETIINEDISPTAAINGFKIDPNFIGDLNATGDITSGGTTFVPDYVFQKYFLGKSSINENYRFPSLEEIEVFIKKNHHLPGITSAVQAQKEGKWNLSESNLKNLEKIEELFLHTINQEKEINKLKAEKETLANELQTLKKDLEEIKSLLKK